MEKLGIEKVDRIRLAGAFGAHIALLDRNSRSLIEKQTHNVEKIETAGEDRFQHHFVSAMAIPHDSDPFTELEKVVKLPERTVAAATAGRRRRKR